MADVADRYRTLSDEFTRRVDAVPDDRWDDPSPCAGWSARDVLRHVIDSHVRMPASVGVEVRLPTSTDDDPRAAWAEARAAMLPILDNPSIASREYDGRLGRTSLEKTVDNFLGFDLLVHGWDIARATGQDETLPAEQLAHFQTVAQHGVETMRKYGATGPPVDVPPDAPEQDRFLALLGRRP
jgi:uncharacterized protein (TIGR03086 family)